LLNGVFQNRTGITEQTGVLQPTDAAPDNRIFAAADVKKENNPFAAKILSCPLLVAVGLDIIEAKKKCRKRQYFSLGGICDH